MFGIRNKKTGKLRTHHASHRMPAIYGSMAMAKRYLKEYRIDDPARVRVVCESPYEKEYLLPDGTWVDSRSISYYDRDAYQIQDPDWEIVKLEVRVIDASSGS